MSMNVIIPYGSFSIFLPSPIPDSYLPWNAGTTYIARPPRFLGDWPLGRATRGGIDFEAIVTHSNVDPFVNSPVRWVEIGPSGTFKAFDQKVGIKHPGGLYAQVAPIDPDKAITACAVFGLEATQVRLKITDPTAGTVYNQTRNLINTTAILDYVDYFFAPATLRDSCLFLDLPPYLNAKYEITATTNNELSPGLGGEIVLGYNYVIGDAKAGSSIDLIDYSTIETDTFGVTSRVKRQSVQTATYEYSMPAGTENAVQRILQNCLAVPCVFHTGEDSADRGTLIYGILDGTPINLGSRGASMATIEVKGLT